VLIQPDLRTAAVMAFERCWEDCQWVIPGGAWEGQDLRRQTIGN